MITKQIEKKYKIKKQVSFNNVKYIIYIQSRQEQIESQDKLNPIWFTSEEYDQITNSARIDILNLMNKWNTKSCSQAIRYEYEISVKEDPILIMSVKMKYDPSVFDTDTDSDTNSDTDSAIKKDIKDIKHNLIHIDFFEVDFNKCNKTSTKIQYTN
jgi:hypothetical protein